MSSKTNPAVDAAKENHNAQADYQVNVDGVKYRLRAVAPALMDAVTNKIEVPTVPLWHNPEMDRDEPNPSHPDYIKALDEANRRRGIATYDALVMFGIELAEGLPEDRLWLKKLKFMEKHGQLSLGEYDLEDDFDLEFLYKRYVLATGDMVDAIGQLSALTAADVKRAGAIFPGNS